MKLSSVQKSKGYLIIGGIGLVFSVGYLGLALQFPLGKIDEPGARVFPIIVGTMLIFASLVTMWEGWQMDKAVRIALPVGTGRKRLLGLVVLIFGYIIILPWLGQLTVSMLFCALSLRLLSNLGWLRILATSLVISSLLYVVFITLLKVPMPHGEFIFYF